jgi:hypothetical protein
MTETPNYQDRQPDSSGLLEQECDLENERTVAHMVEMRGKWKLTKQEKLDPYDYLAAADGKTVALVEMRKRQMNHDKYSEGVFFNKDKFDTLVGVANALWIPAMLMLTFDDGVFTVDLTKIIRPKIVRGDRGNPDYKRVTDNDPVVLIPINRLQKIGTITPIGEDDE